MKDKFLALDAKWIEKYVMVYANCPKCGSHAYGRIESMCFVVHCGDLNCADSKHPFNEDVPEAFVNDQIILWKKEMKREYVKYILRNPEINM